MELTPLFRKILVEWREQWTPSDIVEREELDKGILSQGQVRKITTFTGFRRVGKTYLMYQAIDELIKSGIADKNSVFYVNLEDERIPAETKSLTELLPALREIFGENPQPIYLFLDEVQTIPNWSKWARRVYDSERGRLFLFLSGSSSELSSHDLPTELRGRCMSLDIFPLSLKGFLKFKGIVEADFTNADYSDREKARLLGLLREFLIFGGLPEVVLSDGEKRKLLLLQEYYKTVVRRDIAERHKIRNISLLSDFLRLLLNSTHITISKMCNVLKSSGHKVSKNTLINYLRYAEEAYFAFVLHIFSRKVKDRMLYPKKVYFMDNGFISALSLKFSENMGRLVENAVAVELKRRNLHKPLAELSYWRSGRGEEVDFVVREGDSVRQLVQACYDVGDPDTKNRELKGLIAASKELKCDNLLVITWDYEAEEKLNGGKKAVYMPLCKWLLAGPG